MRTLTSYCYFRKSRLKYITNTLIYVFQFYKVSCNFLWPYNNSSISMLLQSTWHYFFLLSIYFSPDNQFDFVFRALEKFNSSLVTFVFNWLLWRNNQLVLHKLLWILKLCLNILSETVLILINCKYSVVTIFWSHNCKKQLKFKLKK